MATLANRLKELRKSNRLIQAELVKILGVVKTTVSMYETSNSAPSDYIKLKITEYFNISIDSLLGKTEIKNYSEDPSITIALPSDTDYDKLIHKINKFVKYIKKIYLK